MSQPAERSFVASFRLALLGVLLLAADSSDDLNGFRLHEPTVPRDRIHRGGPPRDGIRSVDAPAFVGPGEATWLRPTTPVLGVVVGEDARAYPVHLIEKHQIVNDVLAGVPVAVTYGPIAGAPLAFKRKLDGRTLSFGVSGLLYNANFLLYDRETESLWCQFLGEAIAGPLAGARLERVRVRQEPFGAWMARHPETRVLVRPEPERIDYSFSPFTAYWVQDKIPYPVAASDPRFHAKELVLGVVADGKARAYIGSLLTAAGGRVEDELEGRPIRIAYSSDLASFSWDVPEDVTVTEGYWFAWKAFHPDTEIWDDSASPP